MSGLEELPGRVTAVELQIVQLRTEMRAGFSAIEQRLQGHDQRFEAMDQRFDAVERQIRKGDEETRRYMRVLHEEVLARIAMLQNGRRPRKK